MVRDFTEGIKNAIAEAMVNDLSYQETEIVNVVNALGQDCVVNVSDIEIHGESLATSVEDSTYKLEGICSQLDEVFAEARELDDVKAAMVIENKDETANAYIASLRGLVESINVSTLGKTPESIRQNFAQYHSAYEGSIFGENDRFTFRLDEAGGGLYKTFYDSINVVEPFDEHQEQMENLYAFLAKDSSEVKDWERDAILAYLDSCVITDPATGVTSVDYDKVSMILTGCYTERGCNDHYANDMLSYLADEYDSYYQFRSSYYQYLDYSLEGYANLNAIFTATNTYYQELHTSPTPYVNEDGSYYLVDFGIQVYEEENEPHMIVIDTIEDDYAELETSYYFISSYHDTKHNIYITPAKLEMRWSESLNNKYENSNIRIEDAVVNKLVGDAKNYGIVEGVVKNVVPGGAVFVAVYKKARSYYDVVQNTKNTNESLAANVEFEDYRKYTQDLGMGGQTASCGESDVICINGKINERLLDARIAYYNLTHPDAPITSEQVIADYQSFAEGNSVEGSALESYCGSRGSSTKWEVEGVDHPYLEDDFVGAVSNYLNNHDGVQLKNASESQLNAAVDYVVSHPEYIN